MRRHLHETYKRPRMRRILKERNIANIEDIDEFISEIISGVPVPQRENDNNYKNVVKWLKTNFKNWMIKEYPSVQRITKATDGLPDWIFKKGGDDIQGFLNKNEVFTVKISNDFHHEISHAVDYLMATTRPNQAIDKWPVHSVLEKAAKWGVSGDEDSESDDALDDTGPQLKTILKMGSWKWVRMDKATDSDYPNIAKIIPKGLSIHNWVLNSTNPLLRRETYFMRHCIGTGSYDGGGMYYYSLRSPGNKPKVTIAMNSNGDINQIQGIQNRPPEPKYASAIAALFRHIPFSAKDSNYLTRIGLMVIGKDVLSADDISELSKNDPQKLLDFGITKQQLHNMNLFTVNGIIRKMDEIPTMTKEELSASDLTDDQLKRAGYVRLSNGKLSGWDDMKPGDVLKNKAEFHNMISGVNFTKGLVFSKGLSFSHYPGKSFPAGAKISGNLNINQCRNMSIIPDDVVMDDIPVVIKDSPIKRFPRSQKLKSLTIESANIEILSDISVKGDSIFGGTSVNTLNSCHFDGDVKAKDTNISRIDSGCIFNKGLDLEGCTRLKILEATHFGHGLKLSRSSIEKLPDGIRCGVNSSSRVSMDKMSLGSINIDKTDIKKLPNDMKCIKLTLNKNITELPKDLEAKIIVMYENTISVIPETAKVYCIHILRLDKNGVPSTIDTFYRQGFNGDDDIEIDEDDDFFVPGQPFDQKSKDNKKKK